MKVIGNTVGTTIPKPNLEQSDPSKGDYIYGDRNKFIGPQGPQGETGASGKDGKDGTSVTVTKVTESTEDGGSNVVAFSDGNTVTVKNGSKGSQGDKGDTGAPGVHIGAEEPTDGQVAWIDTDEEPEEETTQIDVVANVGQVIAVKSVDENSKPTEYKAVDLPTVETPDFAANEGETGHILNRTHYVDKNGVVHKLDNKYIDADWMATSYKSGGEVEWANDIAFTSKSNYFALKGIPKIPVDVGIEYDVYWNGKKYVCTTFLQDEELFLGNNLLLSAITESVMPTDAPFCFGGGLNSSSLNHVLKETDTAETVNIVITSHRVEDYNKLPKEFLPDEVALKEDIPEGGGSANIDVTAAVGQTIIVKEVDENGKPTKWESAEYQPRTHWAVNVEILPETTVEIDEEGIGALPTQIAFVDGANYTVSVNGTEYICTAKTVDGLVGIGNIALITETGDTGEPFVICAMDGTTIILMMDGTVSASVTLSICETEIKKLDNKFLDLGWTPDVKTESVFFQGITISATTALEGTGLFGGEATLSEALTYEDEQNVTVYINGVRYEGILSWDTDFGYCMSGAFGFISVFSASVVLYAYKSGEYTVSMFKATYNTLPEWYAPESYRSLGLYSRNETNGDQYNFTLEVSTQGMLNVKNSNGEVVSTTRAPNEIIFTVDDQNAVTHNLTPGTNDTYYYADVSDRDVKVVVGTKVYTPVYVDVASNEGVLDSMTVMLYNGSSITYDSTNKTFVYTEGATT